MIRACERTPSFGELTRTCCPSCNFRSMKTRAPWALTFSVNIRSLSFGSSCRQTSTLTVLAIRFSDRPFDIVLLVPENLRVPRQHVHRKVVPLSDGHRISVLDYHRPT